MLATWQHGHSYPLCARHSAEGCVDVLSLDCAHFMGQGRDYYYALSTGEKSLSRLRNLPFKWSRHMGAQFYWGPKLCCPRALCLGNTGHLLTQTHPYLSTSHLCPSLGLSQLCQCPHSRYPSRPIRSATSAKRPSLISHTQRSHPRGTSLSFSCGILPFLSHY